MLRADAVTDTAQPCFEIGEHEVNDRQKVFSDLYIAPLRDGGMAIAALAQLRITAPVVGDDAGAGSRSALDEAAQRFGASVRNQGEPNPTGVPPGLPLVETAGTLALPNLDSADHEPHVVDATSLAASTSANVGFVGLNVLPKLTSNPILVGAHHADAQLVEYLESGLVARQAELSLELNSRHALCLTGDQVRRPKPHRERRMRTRHDCTGSEIAIVLAVATSQNGWAFGETIGIAERSAAGTDEPVAPARVFKIRRTSSIIRKKALEFRKRARKRQVASLTYINTHGCSMSSQVSDLLPIVPLGDNRISTEQSTR